jgi:hypothetical protein
VTAAGGGTPSAGGRWGAFARKHGRTALQRVERSTLLPPVLGAAPLLVGALRAIVTRSAVWLWGDQAVIDIEARNSLVGRNLLGVYDRYGWHHPGPLWLVLLGLFRWLGAGSAAALVFGSYLLQAVAAASIVVVAARLRGGATAWWAALIVAAYEWDFGPQRLGTVWAPYAIALPVALLVLLGADVVSNVDPWPPALGLVVCASFLVQTDLSTGVVVAAVVLVAAVARAAGGRRPARQARRPWWVRAGVLAGVGLAIWLPPLVQQATTHPGNLSLLAHFFLSHHAQHSWHFVLRALGTVFGAFPLLRGRHGTSLDAKLTWLTSEPVRRRPWYLVYVAGTAVAALNGALRRRWKAAVLGALCLVALVAAALSVKLAYGPPFPYLVIWTGALAVPAWLAAWLAFAPSTPPAYLRIALTPAGALVGAAVAVTFATGAFPMSGTASLLGKLSWESVAAEVSSPEVHAVLVDIDGRNAMPEGAAIVDSVARHDRRVEVDRAALYFFDPSLAPRGPVQLKVVVCCGKGDPATPPHGLAWRARVGGQSIYSGVVAPPPRAMLRRARAMMVLGGRYGADPWRFLRPH